MYVSVWIVCIGKALQWLWFTLEYVSLVKAEKNSSREKYIQGRFGERIGQATLPGFILGLHKLA